MALHRSLPLRPTGLVAGLMALVLGLSACSNGPGSVDDLAAALGRGDAFTADQAHCIASAVFDKYGNDKGTLKKLSRAASYDELVGDNGVAGFQEFFDSAVTVCTGS